MRNLDAVGSVLVIAHAAVHHEDMLRRLVAVRADCFRDNNLSFFIAIAGRRDDFPRATLAVYLSGIARTRDVVRHGIGYEAHLFETDAESVFREQLE
jgi:hypothetical protein